MPWDERVALINRTFPSAPLMGPESNYTEHMWRLAFDRDPELLGRILKDILRADQSADGKGRPGPRPQLDAARARPVVDKWIDHDPRTLPYTNLPFGEAFTMLADGRSSRHVASMTGIPRMTVFRLMKGEITPNSEMLLKAAQGFKKQPSFFVEWRIGVVASAIMGALAESPDKSVRAYETLFWAQRQ
jgi:hypothetical protein